MSISYLENKIVIEIVRLVAREEIVLFLTYCQETHFGDNKKDREKQTDRHTHITRERHTQAETER